MTGRAEDLALALAAAREAAGAVAARFGVDRAVRYKEAEQPVTDADDAADRILQDRLLGARPGYGWLSEESAGRAAAGERSWFVDPIDGTNSFVAGIPEFAVSVGLVEAGRPVVGVVVNPVTGDTYWAVAGEGAARNGRPLRVRARARGAAPELLVSRTEQAKGWYAPFRDFVQVPFGSTALKMCRVAEGAADAFVSFGPKHAWDVCAAALVLAEAGGVVTDLAGAPLRYDGAAWQGLVSSGPDFHAQILQLALRSPAPGRPDTSI